MATMHAKILFLLLDWHPPPCVSSDLHQQKSWSESTESQATSGEVRNFFFLHTSPGALCHPPIACSMCSVNRSAFSPALSVEDRIGL